MKEEVVKYMDGGADSRRTAAVQDELEKLQWRVPSKCLSESQTLSNLLHYDYNSHEWRASVMTYSPKYTRWGLHGLVDLPQGRTSFR